MADMNDVKNRLKTMLTSSEDKKVQVSTSQERVVCVFRLDNFEDAEAVGEALRKNFLVLLDTAACDEECACRIHDFMKGVAYPMQVWVQKMSDHIMVYLPDGYQIQEFQN